VRPGYETLATSAGATPHIDLVTRQTGLVLLRSMAWFYSAVDTVKLLASFIRAQDGYGKPRKVNGNGTLLDWRSRAFERLEAAV
jgi:hypothetical protein